MENHAEGTAGTMILLVPRAEGGMVGILLDIRTRTSKARTEQNTAHLYRITPLQLRDASCLEWTSQCRSLDEMKMQWCLDSEPREYKKI